MEKMSERVALEEYERAEVMTGVRDARRGLVVHAAMCAITLAIHAAFVLRARRAIERRQTTIELEAVDQLRAA